MVTYEKKLKYVLDNSGYSAPQVATLIGVSYSTLRNWTSATTEPQSQSHRNEIDRLYESVKLQKSITEIGGE